MDAICNEIRLCLRDFRNKYDTKIKNIRIHRDKFMHLLEVDRQWKILYGICFGGTKKQLTAWTEDGIMESFNLEYGV